MQKYGFGFGLEAEYLLVDAHTFRPLWYTDLTFEQLDQALSAAVGFDELPCREGYYSIPPQSASTPYIIEGYHLYNEEGEPTGILPKGVEIRTPKSSTIRECLTYLQFLHRRMQETLLPLGYQAVALSYHPTADKFEGPQATRTPDRWRWGKGAMLTYGPDINISLPSALHERLDEAELWAKVNYYAPALTALSVASPFSGGKLWMEGGRVGKAARTFNRSRVAPSIEFHPDQERRIELKPFEMSSRVRDYHCFLLLWLTLLLDRELRGRATDAERVSEFLLAATDGLQAERLREKAGKVIRRAMRVLPDWGFDPSALVTMQERIEHGRTPADDLIALYEQCGSIPQILRQLSQLIPESSEVVASEGKENLAV